MELDARELREQVNLRSEKELAVNPFKIVKSQDRTTAIKQKKAAAKEVQIVKGMHHKLKERKLTYNNISSMK